MTMFNRSRGGNVYGVVAHLLITKLGITM